MTGPLDPAALEGEAAELARFLRAQRWFGAKSRAIEAVRPIASIPLAREPYPLASVLVRATYEEGPDEIYHLVAGVRGERVELDALDDPAAARAVLREVAPEAAAPLAEAAVRPMGAEQSNSSLVLGEAVVLKVYRKIEPGMNPEVELGRFLSIETGFRALPRFLGALERRLPDGRPAMLALAQEFIPSRGDGWKDALAAARALYDRPGPEALEAYAGRARALGGTTAEMHLALASARSDPALAPEPITPADAALWERSIRERFARLRPALGGRGEAVERVAGAIEATFAALEKIGEWGMRIRHHGDYHLGQVLLSDRGLVVLDFEGEPARPLEERRRKHTPLRDAAGMARSFDYAAYAALFERAAPGTAGWSRLEAEGAAWASAARSAFLEAYFETLGRSPVVPRAAGDRERLLAVFELDKALYELGYELDNRPDWVRIPIRGIERIAAARRPAP